MLFPKREDEHMSTYALNVTLSLHTDSLEEARLVGQSIMRLAGDESIGHAQITEFAGGRGSQVPLVPPTSSRGVTGRQEAETRVRSIVKLLNQNRENTYAPEEVAQKVMSFDEEARAYSIDFPLFLSFLTETGAFPTEAEAQSFLKEAYAQVITQEATSEVMIALRPKK